MFRLTRDDANFVQVIHTNAGILGESAPIGHIDFCVNGGTMQPGCQREPQIISKLFEVVRFPSKYYKCIVHLVFF